MILHFTLQLLFCFLSSPDTHQWIEVPTSDSTMNYYYDINSIRINDSTTSAWVKHAPKNSSLYKIHYFVFQCEKIFVSCDSEILYNEKGYEVDNMSEWEISIRRGQMKKIGWNDPGMKPDWKVLEAICAYRSPSPLGSIR